jgi:hypothetical protein
LRVQRRRGRQRNIGVSTLQGARPAAPDVGHFRGRDASWTHGGRSQQHGTLPQHAAYSFRATRIPPSTRTRRDDPPGLAAAVEQTGRSSCLRSHSGSTVVERQAPHSERRSPRTPPLSPAAAAFRICFPDHPRAVRVLPPLRIRPALRKTQRLTDSRPPPTLRIRQALREAQRLTDSQAAGRCEPNAS